MTDEPPRFAASHTKLVRARKFIDELRAELAAYKANDPACAKFVPSTGEVEVTLKSITDVPGAIVGDAIHNMRSALDLMVSEMARLKKRSDRDVYFPFSDSADTLDAAIQRKCFRKCGEDAIELLKSLRPYRGGNEALRLIHDLDIRDKHTALILTTSHVELEIDFSYDIADPASGTFNAHPALIYYRFPKDSPLADANVIETLEEFVQLVERVLEAFAGMVAARM